MDGAIELLEELYVYHHYRQENNLLMGILYFF